MIYSGEYAKRAQVSLESIRKYYDGYDIVEVKAETLPNIHGSMTKNVLAARPGQVLKCFNDGYQTVVFVGADLVFYDRSLEHLIESDVERDIFFPHMLTPPPRDGYFPKVDTTINSDLVIWRNTYLTREFLDDMEKYLTQQCDCEYGHFYDQTYLQFALSQTDSAVSASVRHNIAFYNLHERMACIEHGVISSFQFSGFDPSCPEKISIHQNRYKATPGTRLWDLVHDYANKLKS
jgi:hypothetical protein